MIDHGGGVDVYKRQGVDAIIVTAADNALKFKNTAMENASASTMTLCFIFAAEMCIRDRSGTDAR